MRREKEEKMVQCGRNQEVNKETSPLPGTSYTRANNRSVILKYDQTEEKRITEGKAFSPLLHEKMRKNPS